MTTPMDLEDDIMACWNVTADLDLLFEELMENDRFTRDDVANLVLGLQTLYDARFRKLFRDYESFLIGYYGVEL